MSVADWGTIIVGRLTLRETFDLTAKVHATTGVRSISIRGQESFPPLTLAEVKEREEDFMGMSDMLVPVTFTNKPDHDGYYMVADVQADAKAYTNSEARGFNWTLELVRVGPENAVDIESRLTGITRATDHALTPERWHAPSISHLSYYTGTTQPSTMTRFSLDGTITVYRDVPSGINPRWGSTPINYRKARVKILANGIERSAGPGLVLSSALWSLRNEIVRIEPLDSGSANLAFFYTDPSASQFQYNIDLRQNAVSLGQPVSVTVLRNDFEAATVRLIWNKAPGRTLADLTIRRGSRFVEILIQADRSSTLALFRQSAVASTAGTGFIRATANDTEGNRYVFGSARTFTSDLTNGGISKAAVTQFDAFVGVEVDGSAAVAGDTAADLMDQYLGCMTETAMAVRR